MKMIPNAGKPYPDELLYSWIIRLAKMNGLSVPSFINACTGSDNSRRYLHADVKSEYPSLYNSLNSEQFGTMKDLYLQLTTFKFEAIMMPQGQQTKYINRVFRPADNLNPPGRRLFDTVKICPQCLKEDKEKYGTPYFHRAHQLTGVCTCYKHGSILLEYHGIRRHEYDFNLEDYESLQTDISVDSMQVYAKYAQALLDAALDTNSAKTKNVLFDRLKKLGYGADGRYESFEKAIKSWKHADLICVKDFQHFIKAKLYAPGRYTAKEILPILIFLFPDVNELISTLQCNEPVLEECTCPVCGKSYCTTPTAVKDGWGCPYCESSISENDRFKHLIEIIGHGEYHPLQEFHSLNDNMMFHHDKCGNDIELNPREIIFYGKKCICENRVTFEKARNSVESHEGFKLIEYHNTTVPVKIRHEECGMEFTCMLDQFLRFPTCRICKPSILTEEIFEKRIHDLVGDEYSIVEGYVDQDTKIKLRHNVCGCVQSYKPSNFFDGMRCRQCSNPLYHDDLEKMLDAYSAGKYIITDYGQNVCVVKNTETNESFNLPTRKIAQEIRRPTPSPILPVDQDKKQEYIPVSEWDTGYQMLVEYKKEYGTVSVLQSVTYRDYPLGIWCKEQRNALNAGWLKNSRKQKLDDIGFEWNPQDAAWNEWYELFSRYVKQTGTTAIGVKTYFNGRALGSWVDAQRQRFKEGKLSEERIKKLEDLGFTFNAHDAEWNRKYHLYECYIEQTGDPYIPSKTVFEGEILGIWVEGQRGLYKAGKLSKERAEQLLKLNPDIFKTEWEKSFDLYARYINETGNFYVTIKTVYEGKTLGAWVHTQIRYYKQGKLSNDKIKKLLELNPHIFD